MSSISGPISVTSPFGTGGHLCSRFTVLSVQCHCALVHMMSKTSSIVELPKASAHIIKCRNVIDSYTKNWKFRKSLFAWITRDGLSQIVKCYTQCMNSDSFSLICDSTLFFDRNNWLFSFSFYFMFFSLLAPSFCIEFISFHNALLLQQLHPPPLSRSFHWVLLIVERISHRIQLQM